MKMKDIEKEVQKIKKVYDNVIVNYVNLNNIFDLNNPLEIFILYINLAYNGYLSKNHIFVESTGEKEELLLNYKSIRGADVLNGSALCRHLSQMLKNIYDNISINNEVIPTYLFSKDEELTYHKIGNHVINLVSSGDKSYYLDPMNCCRWEKVGKKNLTCFYGENMFVSNISSWSDILNYNNSNIKRLINIRKMLSLYCETTEDDVLMIKQVHKIYKNNLDIFESFYNENSEQYNEITSKLWEIKKKIMTK